MIGANARIPGEFHSFAADFNIAPLMLGLVLTARGMTLTELSRQVGVSLVNLSVLKNDRAKAIRFSTRTAIGAVLDCQVVDLLVSLRVPV